MSDWKIDLKEMGAEDFTATLTGVGNIVYTIFAVLVLFALGVIFLVPAVIIAIFIGVYYVYNYLRKDPQTFDSILNDSEEITSTQEDDDEEITVDFDGEYSRQEHGNERWVKTWKHVRHKSSDFTMSLISRVLDVKPKMKQESFDKGQGRASNSDEIIAVPTQVADKIDDEVLSHGYFLSTNGYEESESGFTADKSVSRWIAGSESHLSIAIPTEKDESNVVRLSINGSSPSWLSKTARDLDTVISVSSPTLSSSFAYKNFISRECRNSRKDANIGEVLSV